MWHFFTLYFLATAFLIIENATAADIQLTLNHYSIDENVTVTVENNESENEELKGKLIAMESRLEDLEAMYIAISTLPKEVLVKLGLLKMDQVQKTVQ